MKGKKVTVISTILSIVLLIVLAQAAMAQTGPRKMERLNRDTIAVKVSDGVYLSWRLMGDESLAEQAFDIYRNGTLIHTTAPSAPTCYTDPAGTAEDVYLVVRAGVMPDGKAAQVWTTNITGSSDGVINSAAYMEFPIDKPADDIVDVDAQAYSYDAGDVSVGDLDGDGAYEIILKWDPSNQKDNGTAGYTGIVYIDAYKQDGTKLWRIDMGKNIRAGAHYTQVIVYDFDNDGKAEVAMKTAPGTIDGTGSYVTDAGTTEEIRNADNLADYRTKKDSNTPQRRTGHIVEGPEYLTMFQGETGMAVQTIDYDPARGTIEDWGDGYGNRGNRYLAGVAYLDGHSPSLIMCRGYYARSVVVAYDWDGIGFNKRWVLDSNDKGNENFAGQGNHSLIVSDVDCDGLDEIVYGSAVVDHDGSVLNNTGHGHGDVLHVSDFDNDGEQEILQSHEDYKTFDGEYGVEYRKAGTGEILFHQNIKEDVSKGVMGNFDDDHAVQNPQSSALFWTSSRAQFYDNNGAVVAEDNSPANRRFFKHFLYWDGKLDRELLDGTMLAKLRVENDNKFTRFYFGRNPSFADVNASTGGFPLIAADLLGDWREEVVLRTPDNEHLRIYTSCIPTDYRIPTLMHDSQYRTCVAAENVAYNQVPHTSYYIGSLALARDESGNQLNYLAPKTPYTQIETVEKSNAPLRIIKPMQAGNDMRVELINDSGLSSTLLLAAVYDEHGTMVQAVQKNCELLPYQNTVLLEGVGKYLNTPYEVKIFAWDSLNQMKPMAYIKSTKE